MNSIRTVEKESSDLALHVDLCAQRYNDLDHRLGNLESKVDDISENVNKLRSDQWKVLITTVGTVVASVISLLIVLLVKL